MLTRATLPLAIILAATACKSPASGGDIDILKLETLEIVATDAFTVDITINDIAFAPNNGASWLGQIIFLDGNGTVHTAGVNGDGLSSLSNTPYDDVVGIVTDTDTSIFVGRTDSGSIQGYTTRDTGTFEPMIVSVPEVIQKFCGAVWDDTAWAVSRDGDALKLGFSLNGTDVLNFEILETVTPPENIIHCDITYEGDIYATMDGGQAQIGNTEGWVNSRFSSLAEQHNVLPSETANVFIATDPKSGQVVYGDAKKSVTFDIIPGLSIPGVDRVDFVSGTTQSFGSVYNQGLLTLFSKDTQQVTLIALLYARERFENLSDTTDKTQDG